MARLTVDKQFRIASKIFDRGSVSLISTGHYEPRQRYVFGVMPPGFCNRQKVMGHTLLLSFSARGFPPQIPALMKTGATSAFCVGHRWIRQAAFKGIGVPVFTNNHLWKHSSEHVFGTTQGLSENYRNTALAMIRTFTLSDASRIDDVSEPAGRNDRWRWNVNIKKCAGSGYKQVRRRPFQRDMTASWHRAGRFDIAFIRSTRFETGVFCGLGIHQRSHL